MLEKPFCGWCKLTLGDYECYASFVTDFHLDILQALLNIRDKHINNALGSVITIDTEGSGVAYLAITDYHEIFLVDQHDNVHYLDMTVTQLAETVVNDIYEHLDEWSTWSTRLSSGHDDKMLKKLLKRVRKKYKISIKGGRHENRV